MDGTLGSEAYFTQVFLNPSVSDQLQVALTWQPTTLPDIALNSATTTDAQNVNLNYSISGSDLNNPFQVAIYRSPTQSFSVTTAVPLGIQATIPAVDASGNPSTSQGVHSVVVSLPSVIGPDASGKDPYVFVVANPPGSNHIPESDDPSDANDAAPLALGMITPTAPNWAGDGGLDYGYTISNANLPQATTEALYWAPVTTFDSSQDTLIPDSVLNTQTAAGTYGPFHVTPAQLGAPPEGAKYLLAVADPDHTVSQNPQVVSLVYDPINMISATSQSSGTISFTYDISEATPGQPFAVSVYRSSSSTFDPNTANLVDTVTEDVDGEDFDETLGQHSVDIQAPDALLPDPLHEYLFVVADPNHQIGDPTGLYHDADFQIEVLGVVAHGGNNFAGLLSDVLSGPKRKIAAVLKSWKLLSHALPGLSQWANEDVSSNWAPVMANTLMTADHYDDVIAFDWAAASITVAPGRTEEAGSELAAEIVDEADELTQGHEGDVVDLHLIGHSEGAVVISQALEDLMQTTDPALEGSYIRMTLLDPHPARTYDGNTHVDFAKGRLGKLAKTVVDYVEKIDNDPLVVIPPNVDYAELYTERTPVEKLSGLESIFNLYGGTEENGAILNDSDSPLHVSNLSSYRDPALGYIGHSEVREWYQKYVVAAGMSLSNTLVV